MWCGVVYGRVGLDGKMLQVERRLRREVERGELRLFCALDQRFTVIHTLRTDFRHAESSSSATRTDRHSSSDISVLRGTV